MGNMPNELQLTKRTTTHEVNFNSSNELQITTTEISINNLWLFTLFTLLFLFTFHLFFIYFLFTLFTLFTFILLSSLLLFFIFINKPYSVPKVNL